jgi:hypothetical protein
MSAAPPSLSIAPGPRLRVSPVETAPALRVGESPRLLAGRGAARVELRACPAPSLRLGRSERAVTIQSAPGLRVLTGLQGVAGPPGRFGGADAGYWTAGETMGGHTAVRFDAGGLLRPADPAQGHAAVGMIRDAVVEGAEVLLYQDGAVNGFAGLVPGSVYYLGDGGGVSLTPPTAGSGATHQTLGTAGSETTLALALSDPILV